MELDEARIALEKSGYQIRVSVTGFINANESGLNLRVVRIKMFDNYIELIVAHFERPDIV